MLEALIDAIQDLLSNSDGNHVDVDSSDFWDQLDLQGVDLSQYTTDEIREALDYALAHDGGVDMDFDSDSHHIFVTAMAPSPGSGTVLQWPAGTDATAESLPAKFRCHKFRFLEAELQKPEAFRKIG